MLIFRNSFFYLFFGFFTTTVFPAAAEDNTDDSGHEDTLKQLRRRDNEHPLLPVIRWAEKERPRIQRIKDYTTRMTKRECIDGIVQEPQVMEVKIRHEPFSVYLKCRFPARQNGQEAIFVRDRNDGKVIAHGAGFQRTLGNQRLDPEGPIAMRGNKYSITEIGILNLIDKLLEVGRKDVAFDECDVVYYQQVEVGERKCVMIEVSHPVPRKNFRFHIARIFIDAELKIPIRYESHDWPVEKGKKPGLIEEYTYEDLRINIGLTDTDFDPRNPDYGFAALEHHRQNLPEQNPSVKEQ